MQTQNIINDRDIIFSPNKTVQQPGKIMYFDPTEFEQITRELNNDDDIDDSDDDYGDDYVPWLEPLKHSLYLVMNQKINERSNER